MIFKELEIPQIVIDFLASAVYRFKNLQFYNAELEKICGIKEFFNSSEQIETLNKYLLERNSIVSEPNRKEYGDFQTNPELSLKSVEYIETASNTNCFEFILEPTCGKGNFIIAALTKFSGIKRIVGIEIYQPYIWETKFKILEFFLTKPQLTKPDIEIIHANVFDFDFKKLSIETKALKTLVIGNPPWVTNSELSSIDSKNLPIKTNFKNYNGFDAITGKGNFDIAEYISLLILKHFSMNSGCFGFLIKNSVVKNLLFDQKNNRFPISEVKKLTIDAKREFNVSVDACFFVCKFDSQPEYICRDIDFYSQAENRVFGWEGKNFVNSIEDYKQASVIEGIFPFEWRQGIKHDCAKIMEFEMCKEKYINGLNQKFHIENDLVYGLLKSSDLKGKVINSYRKLTIVTQKKIGQETNYIQHYLPLTYEYLDKNREFFDKRKSSIYRGKPQFSIFGVGDYSFMPYKVAISGMYKSTHFSLVLPVNGKPVMLDDTCYFIGFKEESFAKVVLYMLNHQLTQNFLRSIIFPDSKRSITKEILMRIDLKKLYELIDYSSVEENANISLSDWTELGEKLDGKNEIKQLTLF